jgi:cell division transport system permease protein
VRAWLRHHGVSFAQTMRRFASSPLASLLNALVIGVALALPLGGYVLLANLQQFARGLATDAQISVFLQSDASKPDIAEADRRLRGSAGVAKVEFVGREQALAALRRSAGMADVIESLRNNPLPDAFVVTLASNEPELAHSLEEQFKRFPKVAHVQADSAWVQRVSGLLRFGRTAVVLMATLLSFALVAVTFNTIRLQIVTQRDEIEVSKLIGATNAYIRRPFFYLGALQGMFGGLAACMIVQAAVWVLNRDLAGLATLYGADAKLQLLALTDSVAVLAFAAAIGWLGALVSVSKHLYKIEPR